MSQSFVALYVPATFAKCPRIERLKPGTVEEFAEIMRSEGVPSVYVELSRDVDIDPCMLHIFFGSDAEK